MTLSEAIEAATAIVDRYPNGGRDAGKGYLGALAAILGKYPRSIAIKCAEPLYGITFECKFLPTVADIVAWCERKAEPLYRDYEREKRIAEQLAERARFEERQKQKPAAQPGKRYTYGEFLQWAKDNNKPPRPIGASEPGGYLGPAEKPKTSFDGPQAVAAREAELAAKAKADLIARFGQAAFDAVPDRE